MVNETELFYLVLVIVLTVIIHLIVGGATARRQDSPVARGRGK